MKRIIVAGLAAGLAVVLTGCPGKDGGSKPAPPASERFDQKEVPKRGQATKGAQPG